MKTKEQYLEEIYSEFPEEILSLQIKHYLYEDVVQQIQICIYNEKGGSKHSEISDWAIKQLANKLNAKINSIGHIDLELDINISSFLNILLDLNFTKVSKELNSWSYSIFKYDVKDLDDLKNKICEVLSIKPASSIKKFKDLYE